STPQPIGATAVPGSLDPKLTPAAGNPAAPNDSSTLRASSSSDGTLSPTAGVTPSSLPATRLATITPRAFERCTLWGVATTTTSGLVDAKRRPSSSIPARVTAATSRSSGAQASATAIPPCGAMAANTRGTTSPPRRAGEVGGGRRVGAWMRHTGYLGAQP